MATVTHQDGRVVKALDLSSNGRMSAWVRSPLLVDVVFGIRCERCYSRCGKEQDLKLSCLDGRAVPSSVFWCRPGVLVRVRSPFPSLRLKIPHMMQNCMLVIISTTVVKITQKIITTRSGDRTHADIRPLELNSAILVRLRKIHVETNRREMNGKTGFPEKIRCSMGIIEPAFFSCSATIDQARYTQK